MFSKIPAQQKKTHIYFIVFTFIILILLFSQKILAENESASNKKLLQLDKNSDFIFDKVNLVVDEKEHTSYNRKFTSFQFAKIWESDSCTHGLFEVEIDDLDNDRLNDIVYPSYGDSSVLPCGVHVYENDENNKFNKVWMCDIGYGGVIGALVIGDVDNDSKKEIIAGWYSTPILIFENDSNDSYVQLPYITVDYSRLPIRSMVTEDTDNDGQREILLLKSDSNEGYFAIFENNQVIFDVNDNIYYAEIDVGFLDPDTFPDIVITHGGWPETPAWFEIYEFNDSTYERKIKSLNEYNGFILTSAIADIDLDGKNELVISGIFDSGDVQLLVLKSTINDQFQIVNSISFNANASPMDISIKDILYDEYPEVAVCTHNSGGLAQVFLFSYDGDSLKQIYETGEELNGNGAFFSVDLAFADQDTFPDILIGASIGKALLLEYQPITVINDQELQYLNSSKLAINQNFLNNTINIKYTLNKKSTINLDIYNMQGQKLRSLVNGFKNVGSYEVIWDCKSSTGSRVSNGCYLVRLVSGDSEVTERIILTR